ncbi:MAG: hypothetical protein HFE62_00105 [Firmicutes bacterium]|nr:hypothetical protein [Bacillota bacterium]
MEKEAVFNKCPVDGFMAAKNELFKYFKCESEYFVQYMQNLKWKIKNEGDFYFLNYWNGETQNSSATVRNIVKKGGMPLIYKTNEYTMIIGIDCVKIGFIFRNSNEIS